MTTTSKGEQYAQLIENLRKAQENSSMMAHLINEGDTKSRALAIGWLKISEQLKLMSHVVITLAKRGLQ